MQGHLCEVFILCVLCGGSPLAQGPAHPPAAYDLVSLSFTDTNIRDVLQALAAITGTNIVADSSVTGSMTIELTDVRVAEALRAVAAAGGLYVREEDGVVLLSKNKLPPPRPQIELRDGQLFVQAQDTDVAELIALIARAGQLNVVPQGPIEGKVSVSLSRVSAEDALLRIVDAAGLEARQEDKTFLVGPREPPAPLEVVEVKDSKLTIDVQEMEIQELLRRIGEMTGIDMLVEDEVQGKASVRLTEVDPAAALEQILTVQRLTFAKRDDIYVVGRRPEEGEGGPVTPTLRPKPELSVQAGPDGRVTLKVVQHTVQEVLDAIAVRTGVSITLLEGAVALPGSAGGTEGGLQQFISLELHDVPLDRALKEVLVGTGLSVSSRQPDAAEGADEGSDQAAEPPRYFVGDASRVESVAARPLVTTEIIPIEYLDPEQVTQLLSPLAATKSVKVLLEHNALAVTGPDDVLAEIKEELAKLDKPQPQVLLEAKIISVSANAITNAGVSLSAIFQQIEADFAAGQGIFTSTGHLATKITAAVNALITEGKAKVLANPRIVTISGLPARISMIEDRFFRTGTLQPTTTGPGDQQQIITPIYPYATLQSVQAGIILQITPKVGAGGHIRVKIQPEVSSVTGTGPEGLPEVSRRTAETEIVVRDGETVFIGGLRREEESVSVTRTPVLSEIPIVGELFKRRTRNRSQSDLIILVTPHILQPGEQFPIEGPASRDLQGLPGRRPTARQRLLEGEEK